MTDPEAHKRSSPHPPGQRPDSQNWISSHPLSPPPSATSEAFLHLSFLVFHFQGHGTTTALLFSPYPASEDESFPSHPTRHSASNTGQEGADRSALAATHSSPRSDAFLHFSALKTPFRVKDTFPPHFFFFLLQKLLPRVAMKASNRPAASPQVLHAT